MKIITTKIPDVLLFEPEIYGDERGFFYESFNANAFKKATGIKTDFVQDNHSKSIKNVLRGLHYQIEQAQGKLVRVTEGKVFDVAVDLRRSSKTYGQWVGEELSFENKRSMWVPPGFAHGFLVLSETAEFLYKTTDFYAPAQEWILRWDDPTIGIKWPLQSEPALSVKDNAGKSLEEVKTFD